MGRYSFMAAGFAAASIVFCACSSVPDITFTEDDATATDGGPGGSDASVDSPIDGPRDVVTDCNSTGPEICDDGIDNDCNGKTDCADTACQPITECVNPAPAGWTLVSFSDATRPACATGYDAPVDLKVVSGTGSGTCSCACSPSTGSACTAGSFSVIVDTTTCSAAARSLAHNTNCTAIVNPIDVPAGLAVASATAPAGPSACAGAATPSAGPVTLGKACAVAASTKFGKGCAAAAQVCAPKATGMGVCITKLGADSCPAPYTQRRTAGTDAVDTRACNACSCEPKGCSGTVELFEAADCTTGAGKATTGAIDTSCDAPTVKNFNAIRYKTTLAAPTNGCGLTAGGFNSTMQGGIAWTEQRTVCCK